MEARMPSEPSLDRGGLVRAVVVHHLQLAGHVGFDSAQELQEFAAAMASMQLADHFPSGDFQRRKQRRRAMASDANQRLMRRGDAINLARAFADSRMVGRRDLPRRFSVRCRHVSPR